MSRGYRLVVVVSARRPLIGAVPASAAPVAAGACSPSFSPLDWIRPLWAEEGTSINPWGRPAPADDGIAPPGASRGLWAETGSEINPWGSPAPVMHNTGSENNPWGLQRSSAFGSGSLVLVL